MSTRPTPSSRRRASAKPQRGWDEAAEAWEDFVETGKDWCRVKVHGPALLRAIGPVSGLKVLDVGCGQGYFSRVLARRGARVVGVDRSTAQLRYARRHVVEEPTRLDYQQLDAQRLTKAFPRGSFDLVVSCMALMDLPRPDLVLDGAHAVLRPRGRLVFSVTHPFNDAPVSRWTNRTIGRHGPRVVDRYFDDGRYEFSWRAPRLLYPFDLPYWHWTLASWVRMIRDAGFDIENVTEPRPTRTQFRREPGLEGPSRVPFWIVWECRRSTGGAGQRSARRRARADRPKDEEATQKSVIRRVGPRGVGDPRTPPVPKNRAGGQRKQSPGRRPEEGPG